MIHKPGGFLKLGITRNNWDDGPHGHQTAWLLEMVYGFGLTTSFGRMLIDSTFYLALGKHFGTSWALERSKWLP